LKSVAYCIADSQMFLMGTRDLSQIAAVFAKIHFTTLFKM